MTSERAAHYELRRALGFSMLDRGGRNWTAFGELWAELLEDRSRIFAVVWDHIEIAARAAPITTMEIGWALITCRYGDMLDWEGVGSLSLDLFVLGEGDDFTG